MDLIVRTVLTERVFPATGWSAASRALSDRIDQISATIIADLPLRKLESGRGLGAKRILRTIWLHCQAISAEKAGRFAYADFLYREIDADLARSGADQDWPAASALAIVPETARELSAEALRKAALNELFLDSHLALFNASAKAGGKIAQGRRSWLHLQRAEHIVRLSQGVGASEPEAFELSLARAKLVILRSGEKWTEAADLIRGYAQRFPGRYAFGEALADLHMAELAAGLERTTVADERIVAMQRAILKLEGDGWALKANPHYMQLLALTHRQLAIAKANEGRLDEAMADMRRSLDYWPDQDGGEQVAQDIRQAMTNLQASMEAVARQVGSQWKTRLNAEGIRLWGIARSGSSKLERYEKSSEREAVLMTVRVSQALFLWRRLHLPPLPKDQLAKASLLLDFVIQILAGWRIAFL